MELELTLDDARAVMYERLQDELEEDVLETTLERTLTEKVTELYDNRDNLVKQET